MGGSARIHKFGWKKNLHADTVPNVSKSMGGILYSGSANIQQQWLDVIDESLTGLPEDQEEFKARGRIDGKNSFGMKKFGL